MNEKLMPIAQANSISNMLRMVLGDTRFPVDVEALAVEYSHQRFPDSPIDKVIGEAVEGFQGMLTANQARTKWLILYNSAVTSLGRKRFTIAHEFGHYLLHRHASGEFHCGVDDIETGHQNKSDIEADADQFASYLLMPLDDFRKQVDGQAISFDLLGHCADRYLSSQGALIACVYRYDPPSGKEFRPWDVGSRMWRALDPRPLFNLPAVATCRQIVLVEGEKCASALIALGVVATTAMNGAKAPIDKTDWSPLKGKNLVIWPDRDSPGWDYAQNAARACVLAGCASVCIVVPPEVKPEKWDAADAVDEGFDCLTFIAMGDRHVIKAAEPVLPSFSLGQLLDDDSPLPPDIIGPRVLTPGSLLVFGGAPKVGKSDFLLAWLAHMAAGATFLGMRPSRPLRIFYLQAEVQYYYLRERVKAIKLPSHRIKDARQNLYSTPQVHTILNSDGVAQVIAAIAQAFPAEPPDIIAIDPLRNVFDGGEGSPGENDNAAMLFFLKQRVERILYTVNPNAGVILVHHTKKMGKKQFEEDPFQALAGAGSLRGYYSSGMVLARPDESSSVRELFFELRNGPAMSQLRSP